MDVVLCWHMHQPDYRLGSNYHKPWTWLHAIKDYSDMAAHLEEVPGARAVVNFSPVLIEQLRDYPARIRACLQDGTGIGDSILDALHNPGKPDPGKLLPRLLRVNEDRIRPRFPVYSGLFDRARAHLDDGVKMAQQDIDDLLVRCDVIERAFGQDAALVQDGDTAIEPSEGFDVKFISTPCHSSNASS